MDPSDGKSTDPERYNAMNPSRMRELHKTWTLADDVALLKNLERFSELIINKAAVTLRCMDTLEDSLNDTSLNVKKVANNFQALADTQFIENRVDDEDDVKVDEPVESSQSSRSPPINLEKAINNCADVIENKFEAKHLPGFDPDDDSPVALIPKNAYQNRRLPHLIGSEEFMNDESLGLLENVMGKEEEEIDDPVKSEEEFVVPQAQEDFEPKSDPVPFGCPKEANDSSASPVVDRQSVASSLEDWKPASVTRHLSFEPPPFSSKPPLVPPDFVDSPTSESDEACPQSNSETSRSPSLTKGVLYKSKTFSSFKTDLAKVLQARSMVPPRRNLAPKRKMSGEFDSQASPVGSQSSHKDETDRVKMNEDEPVPAVRPKTVPSCTTEDDFLIPPTEILQCHGKRRARIPAKRKPPSRRPRADSTPFDISPLDPPENPPTPSPPPPSSLLSPATDEEDLFLLPSSGIPTDLSNSNLFTSASLLSPGAALEDPPIFPNGPVNKSSNEDNWDPFDYDESDSLFSKPEPQPSTSVPLVSSEPSKKKSDLFDSSDDDDFFKDDLFINKRFKSLNLEPTEIPVLGHTQSHFTNALTLTEDLAKALSSDEDDLFSTKPSKTPENKVKTMSKTPVVKDPLLFGNDSE